MKKTSLIPLAVVCILFAVLPGTTRNQENSLPVFPAVLQNRQAFPTSPKLIAVNIVSGHIVPLGLPGRSALNTPPLTREKNFVNTPNGKAPLSIATASRDKWWTSTRPPRLASFGENGIVLTFLAILVSLCAFAYQRYKKMKTDIKREKDEALLKARELMEEEKQTALQLAYRLIREEKEMALRQARETAVQQARELIEQAREEARLLQAKVTSTSVQLANKNDYLLQLQEKLRMADNTECKRIAREIKTNLGEGDHWADFITNFNLLHSHVIDKITRKHPDLTINEIKLVCFVLSGMSNKEIGGLFGVEAETIKKGRYRLKKKLQLKEEESLKFYLDNLE
jgi:DNA-binding CsgD family transcriptional regulator